MRRLGLICVLGVALLVAVWLSLPEPESAPPRPTAEVQAPAPVIAPPARPVITVTSLVDPTTKELTLKGEKFRFLERTFEPELPLPNYSNKRPSGGAESPEEAMADLLSAMASGDWRWALGLFDYDGRAFMLQIAGPNKAEYIQRWKDEFTGHSWFVTRRVDTGDYVILYKRRADRPESPVPHAFKRDRKGQWWLTHDLRSNPVYGYDGPRVKGRADVQIVAR